MPIYEYQCDACGHALEALQKISDSPLVSCPECGKDSLRKKVSAVAFRLKGSGWYETDFKSGDKKNLAGSDGEKPSSSDAKSEGSPTKSSSDSAANNTASNSKTTNAKGAEKAS